MEADDDPMKSRAEQRERWMRTVLDRHERPLVAYAQRRLGHLDAARDVVQECFLRLCRAEPAPADGHLRPWLFRVCRNLTIDHLRKEGRVRTLEQSERLVDGSPHAMPAAQAEQTDESSKLAEHLATLTERQQEVVRLRFQDGLTYREIAVVTEASISHVGVLLHQALATLRRRMASAQPEVACERKTS